MHLGASSLFEGQSSLQSEGFLVVKMEHFSPFVGQIKLVARPGLALDLGRLRLEALVRPRPPDRPW